MWRTMMGFFNVAMAVLSLLSLGQSAPVTSCESLIKPIEIQGREQLLGKWSHIAEGTTIPASNLLTKMIVDSAWMNITAANETGAVSVFQAQEMFGLCFTFTYKTTLENNTLSMAQPFNSSAVLLNTGCPDCLVSYSNISMGERTYSGIQLLSRRNTVTAAELEEFTKQVECLNVPPPAILDPGKGSCPDETTQETETIDLTKFMNEIDSGVFNLLERIMNRDDRIKTLFKMISSSVAELKDN